MARTLIGELLLRVKADTKEAQTVSNALRNIEQDSKRLNSASWGMGLQRQLDKLKATPREMDLVQRSWDGLVKSFQSRNLTAAMRKNDIAVWRQSTVTHLTAVRAEWKRLEEGQTSAMRRFREAARFGAGTLGVYGATHALARGGRGALIAASNERVQQAEMKYAGLSEGERGKIDTSADKYVSKYNLNRAEVLEVLKDSSLNAINTDTALSMADPMMRAMLVLKGPFGKEGAINGLRVFNKAMDNMGVQDPELYTKMLDGYVRSQQVIGQDISPEGYAQAIKFARAPGKAYGKDFISMWLPFMAGETGGSDAGGKIRAAFDNLATGRTPLEQLSLQDELGLREGVVRNKKGKIVEKGKLTQADRFYANPLEWMDGVLKPALEKRGVDVNNAGDMASYVGNIVGNRLAGDMLFAAMEQFDQYKRQKEKRGDNAYGLRAADTIQSENPFAAFDAFKDAMSNLSAAVMPMDAISSGLNTMASVINNFQQSLRDGNPAAWGGLAVGGTVAVGGPVAMLGKAGWDLITAGTALKGSAAALDAAAARFGVGGGGTPTSPTDNKKPTKGNALGVAALLYAAFEGGKILHDGADAATSGVIEAAGGQPAQLPSAWENVTTLAGMLMDAVKDRKPGAHDAATADGRRLQSLNDFIDGPLATAPVDQTEAVAAAQQAGQDMQTALSVEGKPTIDIGPLQAALLLVRQFRSELQGLGGAVSRKAADLESQLNRSFSDHQLTP